MGIVEDRASSDRELIITFLAIEELLGSLKLHNHAFAAPLREAIAAYLGSSRGVQLFGRLRGDGVRGAAGAGPDRSSAARRFAGPGGPEHGGAEAVAANHGIEAPGLDHFTLKRGQVEGLLHGLAAFDEREIRGSIVTLAAALERRAPRSKVRIAAPLARR